MRFDQNSTDKIVLVKKKDKFVLFHSNLGITASAPDLDTAYQSIMSKKEELIATIEEAGLKDDFEGSRWKATESRQLPFVLKATAGTLLLFFALFFISSLLKGLPDLASTIAHRTVQGSVEASMKTVRTLVKELREAPPEKREKWRAKTRELVNDIDPYISEVKTLLHKPTLN